MEQYKHSYEYKFIHPAKYRGEIMELYHNVFGENVSIDQHIWKYESSPIAETKVASVWDTDKNKLIATLSAFKRHIIHNGKIFTAYTYGDGMVRPGYQGQGIYRKLFDFMNASNNEDGAILWMGYPNDQAAPIYRKYENNLELYSTKVYVFLNGTKNITSFIKFRGISAMILIHIGTMLIRVFNYLMGYHKSYDMILRPIDTFDDLPQKWSFEIAQEHQFFPLRDRLFLDWRVKNAPVPIVHDLLSFWIMKENKRIGYCVLYQDRRRNVLKLVDLLCENPKKNLKGCLATIRSYAISHLYDAITTNVASALYGKAMWATGFLKIRPVRSTVFFFNQELFRDVVADDTLLFQMPIDRDNYDY